MFGDVVAVDGDGDTGVGVGQVAVFLVCLPDDTGDGRVVGTAGVEVFFDLGEDLIGDRVDAGLGEFAHPVADRSIVFSGEVEQKAFQVAGDEDVHGRGHGGVERPVPVIGAGRQEVREDVVGVGRADELADRHAHELRVVGREDVAEVARGDDDVHRLTRLQVALLEHVGIGAAVVDDLRHETAPVDGVRGGEHESVFREFRADGLVGEDLLDAALGIVEVALDGADPDVGTLLGDHLEFLHGADTVSRIEDEDAGAGHVFEALQSRFAGVTGRRDQDDDLFVGSRLLRRGGQKVGQQLERHVLERAGGTAEQFEDFGLLVEGDEGRHFVGVEFALGVGAADAVVDLLRREVREVQREDLFRPLNVGHRDHVLDVLHGQFRDLDGDEQAAVFRDAPGDGLAGLHT